MRLKPADKAAALAAFWARVAANEMREDADNASLPAGSPMFFTCAACFGPIILAEGFLSPQELCYDCRDLADLGWIFEMSPKGTGWNARR